MVSIIVLLVIVGIGVYIFGSISERIQGRGPRKAASAFPKDGLLQILDTWQESGAVMPYVKGRIRNNSNVVVPFVEVEIRYYNKRNEVIGTGRILHSDFAPNDVWVFEDLMPHRDMAHYDVNCGVPNY